MSILPLSVESLRGLTGSEADRTMLIGVDVDKDEDVDSDRGLRVC
jgi:hypothetical protein